MKNRYACKFSKVCKATSVTHTKRIYRNLLRKETSFVCYTSSVLRKSRHIKQFFVFFVSYVDFCAGLKMCNTRN